MRGLNLPNAITIGRIVLAVGLVPLLFMEGFGTRLFAFVVFLAAALSDLWDGYLARSQNLITDLGKLLDPLADKLLLAATFLPFYALSHGVEPQTPFPWFGGKLPWWIVAVIFGREIFITIFRGYAARRGVVLAAGKAGKYKAVFQNIFVGAVILWYAFKAEAAKAGWSGLAWTWWERFHFAFTVVVLTIAVVLTVASMIIYLREYRTLDLGRRRAS